MAISTGIAAAAVLAGTAIWSSVSLEGMQAPIAAREEVPIMTLAGVTTATTQEIPGFLELVPDPRNDAIPAGPWPSPTALQYCGAPNTLTQLQPSGYNDWTIISTKLEDSIAAWREELASFAGKPFWGYMNWVTPEDPGALRYTLFRDASVIFSTGVSAVDLAGGLKGDVCSLRPAMQEYILAASRAYLERGLSGLFMDMAWVGWNGCAVNYDPETVAGWRTWAAQEFSAEELRARGIEDITTFDLATHARTVAGATTTARGNPHDPILSTYFAYQNQAERAFILDYRTTMREIAAAFGRTWSFTLNRPNASMFIVLDLLDTVRHETFLGHTIEHDPYERLPDDALRYPERNLIPEFKLFADHGKRMWVSNTPPFRHDFAGRDIALFTAESYAAGGIGNFPLTAESAPWGQMCATNREESPWLVQAEEMIAPVVRMIAEHPEIAAAGATGARVALLYPLDSYLYRPAETKGFTPGEQDLAKDQDEAFVGAGLLLQDFHIPYRVVAFAEGDSFPSFYPLSPGRIAGYDVIVIPGAWALSDTQIATLTAFAEGGGQVLAFGRNGSHDLAAVDRYDARAEWNARVHAPEDQHVAVGEGIFASFGHAPTLQEYYYYPEDRPAIRARVLAQVNNLLRTALSTSAPADVHILPVRVADGSKAYHMLNYQYDRDTDAFTPVEGMTLRVAIPTRYRSRTDLSVRMIAPGFLPTAIPYTRTGDMVTITLPTFEYYAIVKVGAGM